nr:aldehyde ferredoxin oxidoreductase N-terminal domain-containing protein [Candidatus Freyrarchaeum guaymaensis]
MEEYYGYAGSILDVDLTTGRVKREKLNLQVARSFIGGLGVNIKLWYDLVKPGVDPLSPENAVIIGVGPLVGTAAPGSSRVYSLTKLPVNGAVGWGGGGGVNFGCMLKNAGFDHVIIRGRAEKPVYISICDGEAEIVDAGSLWGEGIGKATDTLKEAYGGSSGVLAIGQGGENLVRFSMAFIDKLSTIGRGGLGAVMGSKNLKAIVVKGTKGVRVADPKRFKEICSRLYERIRSYPKRKDAQRLGFLNFMRIVPEESYLEFKMARVACVGCPIGDKEILQIRKGKFKGFTKYASAFVNTLLPYLYGGLGYDECISLTDVLDDYGLDMFETFELLKFTENLYKNGLITDRELGGPPIKLNDYDSLKKWFDNITYRRGFGDVLAEGFKYVLERYGDKAGDFAPCVVKGMVAYQSVRGPVFSKTFTPFELGMVVHPRGPASAPGGSSPLYFTFGRPLDWIKRHFDRMGIPKDAQERILTEKEGMAINVGRLTKYAQQFLYICGSLGTCGRGQINRFYSLETFADLYSAATGFEVSGEELMTASERIFNLEKAINVMEGFTRKDDVFPEKWFEKPLHLDYYEKVEITRDIAYGLLDDYYDERGWNVEKGIPTKEKLIELGLKDVAEDLEKLGLL